MREDVSYSEVGSSDVAAWRRCRVWLSILIFFGFIFLYAQRVGMSVAIVCMVNQTAVRQLREAEMMMTPAFNASAFQVSLNESNIDDEAEQCDNEINSGNTKDGPFVWTKQLQGHILGSFFYGYLISQVPAGMLAERFNAKWVFVLFYALSAVGTVLTPLAANIHFGALLAVRAMVGLGSGGIFPTTHCILGRWAPPLERSILTGIAYAGFSLGNVIALPVSGLLCENGFSEGWDSIFYLIGIASCLWLVLFMVLVGGSPQTCAVMTKVEQEYIRQSLNGQISKQEEGTKRKVTTPWASMLRSPAVWAIIAANVTSDWGIYTMLTNIPTYMYEVLHFDMASNGFFSALPFLGMWLMMTVAPPLADKLQSSKLLSTTACRKLLNSFAEFGTCIFLISLGFVNCSQTTLAVALLTLGATVHGATYSAWLVNPMDIAPQFAGTIFGISNCLGAMTGFIAPPVAAALTPNQTREEWQRVFFVAAGVYAFGGLIYLIFARGELQPWATTADVDTSQELEMESPVDEKGSGLLSGEKERKKKELV